MTAAAARAALAGSPRVSVARVPLERVVFHPRNVRRDLGDLRELTASIERFGILQPVTVEWYGEMLRLRMGHRRVAAARLAGLRTVPALVHRDALEDDEFLMVALHENTQRRGLDERERRDTIGALLEAGATFDSIAAALGVHPSAVRRWARSVRPAPARIPASPPAVGPSPAVGPPRPASPVAGLRRVVRNWDAVLRTGLSAEMGAALADELRALLPESTTPEGTRRARALLEDVDDLTRQGLNRASIAARLGWATRDGLDAAISRARRTVALADGGEVSAAG